MKKVLLLSLLLCLLLLPAMAEDMPEATVTPAPTEAPAQPEATGGDAHPMMDDGVTPTPRPTEAPLPEDPFLARVVEISRRMDMLSESTQFMWKYDYSYSSQEQIEAVAGGDHRIPAQIFHLDGEQLIDLFAGSGMDFTRPELLRSLVDELPMMLLGGGDEQSLYLTSRLARSVTFAFDTREKCGVYVLLYTDATPVMCPWTADGGAVQVSAWFMPDEALAACESAEEVSAWFMAKGMPAAAFEEVQP